MCSDLTLTEHVRIMNEITIWIQSISIYSELIYLIIYLSTKYYLKLLHII